MLKSYKNGNSLFRSVGVGGVFQIKGEVNDSHLNGEEKLLRKCSNLADTKSIRGPILWNLTFNILSFIILCF